MCMLCGDPYSVEKVLGPLLSHQQCYLSGERSLTLETQFCDSKRKVEVILSSYHSAMDFRDELVHGFILVYSVKRRASLSSLTAFSLNIPELPIQLLAVSDEDYITDLTSQLITEGNTLADRLNAHFMTSSTTIQQKCRFTNFSVKLQCLLILPFALQPRSTHRFSKKYLKRSRKLNMHFPWKMPPGWMIPVRVLLRGP